MRRLEAEGSDRGICSFKNALVIILDVLCVCANARQIAWRTTRHSSVVLVMDTEAGPKGEQKASKKQAKRV